MQEQGRLGRATGIVNNVVQQNGDILRLAPGEPGKLAEVRAGRLILDGDIISPADGEAITMRRRLSRDGMIFVALDHKRRPTIEAVGVPLEEDMQEFLSEAAADVTKAISRLKGRAANDRDEIEEVARLATRRAAQRWSGKRPQVRVVSTAGA